MKDEKLWIRIKNFNLDNNTSEFTFSKRLARDNNWKIEFTTKVIEEYKKFIYLCCISNQPITPSDAVDQAWHLHLTYTESYWKKLCGETIRKEIHHNPTKGGNLERDKFLKCYDSTFETYKLEFHQEPPSTIWLNNNKRFKEINFKRINLDRFWLIKKPSKEILLPIKIVLLLLFVSLIFIQAKSSDSSSGILFPIIMILFIIVLVIFGKNKNGRNDGCSYDDYNHYDDGCDSGCSGCSGCGD
ncbi:glycine-rich domain-containing protein [Polaribacter sp.]|uniref:glycine-rich domain-containing protein n=1 Tax=Polaribacter sp. TaxID=1920175 RepID=UPI003F6B6A95